jgi:hypothetical protein
MCGGITLVVGGAAATHVCPTINSINFEYSMSQNGILSKFHKLSLLSFTNIFLAFGRLFIYLIF